LARLRINWRSLSEIAPQAVTTGVEENAEENADENAEDSKPSGMRAERPMLVYVTSDDPTDSTTRKLETVVWVDERVGLGAKLFDTIKISAADASQDRILSENGRFTPRVVLMTRDYKVTDVLQRKQISSGKVLKAMKRLAKKEYVTSFEKLVRNYTKLLNELDRLESKKTAIADQRRRLQEKPNRSREKKIARDEAEHEKAMDAWKKKEEALLKFRFKGKKAEA
jgi:hypothetical protein